jgi:hypothetical protein
MYIPPKRATQRAITVARVLLAAPSPIVMIFFIYYGANPSPERGFSRPIRFSNLASMNIVWWWAVGVGGMCHIASVFLQAYGKRPEYPTEGVDGTDRIFSADCLFEMAVWALSVIMSQIVTVMGDDTWTPSDAVVSTLTGALSLLAACGAIVLFMTNLLNMMREILPLRQFRAFVVRQVGILLQLAVVITAIAIYTHAALAEHDMPQAYMPIIKHTSIFGDLNDGFSCSNGTDVTAHGSHSLTVPMPTFPLHVHVQRLTLTDGSMTVCATGDGCRRALRVHAQASVRLRHLADGLPSNSIVRGDACVCPLLSHLL